MPSTVISCPNCAWDDTIDATYLGRKVKCSKCQTSFVAETGGSYDLAGDAPSPMIDDEPKAPAKADDADDPQWKSFLDAWPQD